jgi:hypothetical protein
MQIHEDLLAELLIAFEKAPLEENQVTPLTAFWKGGELHAPEKAMRWAMSLWNRMQQLNPTHSDQPPVGSCWRINTTIRPGEVVWYLYHD